MGARPIGINEIAVLCFCPSVIAALTTCVAGWCCGGVRQNAASSVEKVLPTPIAAIKRRLPNLASARGGWIPNRRVVREIVGERHPSSSLIANRNIQMAVQVAEIDGVGGTTPKAAEVLGSNGGLCE